MPKKKLLLYVLFHEHWDFLRECLDSVSENLKRIEFDVVVINTRNSNDDFERLTKVAIEYEVRNIPLVLPLVINEVYTDCLAKYDYILRLDADDFLYPRAVETLVREMDQSRDVGAICGSWSVVDSKSRIRSQIIAPREDVGLGIHGACTIFRTKHLEDLKFSELGIDSQDGFATYLHLKKKGVKVRYLDRLIFAYRRHSFNITSDPERLFRNRNKILDYYYRGERSDHIIVLIDTAMADLLHVDRRFISEFPKVFVKDGSAVSDEITHDLPENDSLLNFFSTNYPGDSIVFVNVSKLGVNYKDGLVKSFIQFITIMKAGTTSFVEAITDKILFIDEKSCVSPLNADEEGSTFCFRTINGLHAEAPKDSALEYAMFSHEILNKVVLYDF